MTQQDTAAPARPTRADDVERLAQIKDWHAGTRMEGLERQHINDLVHIAERALFPATPTPSEVQASLTEEERRTLDYARMYFVETSFEADTIVALVRTIDRLTAKAAPVLPDSARGSHE